MQRRPLEAHIAAGGRLTQQSLRPARVLRQLYRTLGRSDRQQTSHNLDRKP